MEISCKSWSLTVLLPGLRWPRGRLRTGLILLDSHSGDVSENQVPEPEPSFLLAAVLSCGICL